MNKQVACRARALSRGIFYSHMPINISWMSIKRLHFLVSQSSLELDTEWRRSLDLDGAQHELAERGRDRLDSAKLRRHQVILVELYETRRRSLELEGVRWSLMEHDGTQLSLAELGARRRLAELCGTQRSPEEMIEAEYCPLTLGKAMRSSAKLSGAL